MKGLNVITEGKRRRRLKNLRQGITIVWIRGFAKEAVRDGCNVGRSGRTQENEESKTKPRLLAWSIGWEEILLMNTSRKKEESLGSRKRIQSVLPPCFIKLVAGAESVNAYGSLFPPFCLPVCSTRQAVQQCQR